MCACPSKLASRCLCTRCALQFVGRIPADGPAPEWRREDPRSQFETLLRPASRPLLLPRNGRTQLT